VHELQLDCSAEPTEQIACEQLPLMPEPLPLSGVVGAASTIT
jgi:hypothetical protein